MNFLDFNGSISAGADHVVLDGVAMQIPQCRDGASGALTFGVRPEHVRLDDGASYRGRVVATEYLGTTQIVTMDTPNGVLKARIASTDHVTPGETIGLTFDPRTITIFDATSGQALRSAANEGVLADG